MDLTTITNAFSAISSVPGLADTWTLDDLWKYIVLVRHIQTDLESLLPPGVNGPPEHLSVETHNFLKLSLGLEDEVAKQIWVVLRDVVWNGEQLSLAQRLN